MTKAKKKTKSKRKALITAIRYFDGKTSDREAKKALGDLNQILNKSIAANKKRRKELRDQRV
jgi:hypothetical protein